MSSSPRIAILAALPREVRALVQGVPPNRQLLGQGIHRYELPAAVVVTAGMGATRAALAFEAALADGPIGLVVSAGLAGSCTAGVYPGSVYEAGLVLDARTGERFRTLAANETVLSTTASIASVGEKSRLAQSYGASLVDMEAATLARLARAHEIGFRAIKGISDAHDFELASLSRFEGKHGQFRTSAFALHTALRPHHWRPAARLGRDSNRALAALGERLQEVIGGEGPSSVQPPVR